MAKKNINLDTVVKQNPRVIMQTIDNDLVLVHPDGKYWGMQAVGAHIWSLMEEAVSVRSIVETMQETYEGDPGQIENNTIAFIVGIANHKLAVVVEPVA